MGFWPLPSSVLAMAWLTLWAGDMATATSTSTAQTRRAAVYVASREAFCCPADFALILPLFHLPQSMAGSAAFMGGAFLAAALCLWYLQGCGVMPELPPAVLLFSSLQAAALGAAVESLPIAEIDNLTVPAAVVLTSTWTVATLAPQL